MAMREILCWNCGTHIESNLADGAVVRCPSCSRTNTLGPNSTPPPDNDLRTASTEAQPLKRKSRTGKLALSALGVVIVVAVVFLRYYLPLAQDRRPLTPERASTLMKEDPATAAKVESAALGAFLASPDSIWEELGTLIRRAVALLPDSERLVAQELQQKYLAVGGSSMPTDEFAEMTRLNEKATELLPQQDRDRLRFLFKQMSDALNDSLRSSLPH